MVDLLDGVTDIFEIVSGVLQEDVLASCMFLICSDYALRTSIDLIKDGFTLKKTRSRRYLVEIMTNAN